MDLAPSLGVETQLLAARAAAGPPPREALDAPALMAAGVAQAAASLARSDRERLRGGVFQPSHILPTMSIEQFGAAADVANAKQARVNVR
jgi:hypothetical protein